MNIHKGRRWLSETQRIEVEKLEKRQQLAKNDKAKFSKKSEEKLNTYYRMIDYLGSVNG